MKCRSSSYSSTRLSSSSPRSSLLLINLSHCLWISLKSRSLLDSLLIPCRSSSPRYLYPHGHAPDDHLIHGVEATVLLVAQENDPYQTDIHDGLVSRPQFEVGDYGDYVDLLMPGCCFWGFIIARIIYNFLNPCAINQPV